MVVSDRFGSLLDHFWPVLWASGNSPFYAYLLIVVSWEGSEMVNFGRFWPLLDHFWSTFSLLVWSSNISVLCDTPDVCWRPWAESSPDLIIVVTFWSLFDRFWVTSKIIILAEIQGRFWAIWVWTSMTSRTLPFWAVLGLGSLLVTFWSKWSEKGSFLGLFWTSFGLLLDDMLMEYHDVLSFMIFESLYFVLLYFGNVWVYLTCFGDTFIPVLSMKGQLFGCSQKWTFFDHFLPKMLVILTLLVGFGWLVYLLSLVLWLWPIWFIYDKSRSKVSLFGGGAPGENEHSTLWRIHFGGGGLEVKSGQFESSWDGHYKCIP